MVFTATAAGILLTAAAPLAVMGAVGALVAAASGAGGHGQGVADRHGAQLWALAAGATLFLQWTVTAVRSAAATAMGDRIDARLQRDLMAAAMAPQGIGHLEDPGTLDLLNVGRGTFRSSWGRPGRLASTLSGLITAWLVVIGAVVTLAGVALPVAVAVAATGCWVVREERVASRTEAAHHYGSTESSRRLEYLYELGATPPAAKEIRVFGLSGFVLDAFYATWRTTMSSVLRPLPRRPTLATAFLGAAVLGSLGWIAARAAAGGLSAGETAICIQALMLVLVGIQQSAWTGLQTELAFATLRRFDEARAAVEPAEAGGSADPRMDLAVPRREIRFEGVAFAYPGAETDSLAQLDLVIPAGRSLAIVGANGAGKSTAVKLLCKLYEPTSGRITVDGVDLAEAAPEAWRRQIAAVFQDSTRFAFPARANIGFGWTEAGHDQAGMAAAAADAEILADLDSPAGGWDRMLSSEYADGVDLSGGQWQKLALARALFAVRHGAGVLILDEPAAHLDARAEARLHERFIELTEGLTTVVISHRFSTVRRASTIAVLDSGRVVEQGTHEELVSRGGVYAHMFELQAARFAEPEAPEDLAPEMAGER